MTTIKNEIHCKKPLFDVTANEFRLFSQSLSYRSDSTRPAKIPLSGVNLNTVSIWPQIPFANRTRLASLVVHRSIWIHTVEQLPIFIFYDLPLLL